MTAAEAHAAGTLAAGMRVARRIRLWSDYRWDVAKVERVTATTILFAGGERIRLREARDWTVVDDEVEALFAADRRRSEVRHADLRAVETLTDEQVETLHAALTAAGVLR